MEFVQNKYLNKSDSNHLENELGNTNANQENEEDSDCEFYSSIYDNFSKPEQINQYNDEMKIRKIIYGDQNVSEEKKEDCFEQIELPNDTSSLKQRPSTVQYQSVKKINFVSTTTNGTI